MTGQFTSPKWVDAFSRGCGGKVMFSSDILQPGGVAMFGNPTLFPLLREAIAQGRDWYYGDHAYFRRHKFYRITKNAWQHNMVGEATPHRWERLRVRMKAWHRTGSKIILCPQSPTFFQLHGLDVSAWIQETTDKIRQYSDRQIKVVYKAGGHLAEEIFRRSLIDAHAVVVYTSVAGAQAVMNGVPCFATGECVSKYFGTDDLSRIEKPVRPENREQMAWLLADNQWTFDEIQQGMAWEKIK